MNIFAASHRLDTRAIAALFAEYGASVVVADIRDEPREGGKPTQELVEDHGGEAVFVECDVTDYDDCVAAVDAADEFGGIDLTSSRA